MRRRIVELAFISLFLVACGATPAASLPEATPNTETVVPQAATDIPVATAMPEVATATQMANSLSTPVAVDAPDATALAALTMAQLAATITPDPAGVSSSMGDVATLAIASDAAGQFFATIVTGMLNNFDDPHAVTIFQKQGTKFVNIAYYDFKNGEDVGGIELLPNPDPNHALFIVRGGLGAHSSFGTVFSFDGKTLISALGTQSEAGGGALVVQDINGDGINDVFIDTTDYLVFCYVCGVQNYSDTVYSWDGTKFVEQKLTASSDATIQKAIDYAKAQRWNMVTTLLPTITAPTTDSDKWNVGLLTHWSTSHIPSNDSTFPLMDAIFYGDYDAVVKMLQAVGAVEVANPNGKWFAGPIAEGIDVATDPTIAEYRKTVFDNVVKFSTLALTQDDTLTSARFLRGWAKTMANPKDADGLKDLEAVANSDPFYAAVRDAVVSR